MAAELRTKGKNDFLTPHGQLQVSYTLLGAWRTHRASIVPALVIENSAFQHVNVPVYSIRGHREVTGLVVVTETNST